MPSTQGEVTALVLLPWVCLSSPWQGWEWDWLLPGKGRQEVREAQCPFGCEADSSSTQFPGRGEW